jgi:hypothetical protein
MTSNENHNEGKVGKNLMFVGPNAALIALSLGTIKVSTEAHATRIGGTYYIDSPVHMLSRIVQMPATSHKDAFRPGTVMQSERVPQFAGTHSSVYSTVC